MTCDIWLRRDYLLRHDIQPDEPPCDHDPEHCPPPDQPLAQVFPIRPEEPA